jgi:uncharacterized protein (DUF2147 family)
MSPIKVLVGLLLAVSFLAMPSLAADDPLAIVGLWETEQDEPGDTFVHVEIRETDGVFDGRIVWMNETVYDDDDPEAGQPQHDRENPDESLRDRPILGLELMYGFRFDEDDGKWVDGRIYDAKGGKEYRCKITMKDIDTLEIFGYIKVGFIKLGRNTTWKRLHVEG